MMQTRSILDFRIIIIILFLDFDVFIHTSISQCLDTSWDISGAGPWVWWQNSLRLQRCVRGQTAGNFIHCFLLYLCLELNPSNDDRCAVFSSWWRSLRLWGVLALSLSDEEGSTDSSFFFFLNMMPFHACHSLWECPWCGRPFFFLPL